MSINIYTQVGLVTLIGVISKYGILSSPTSCRSRACPSARPSSRPPASACARC
ncbi:MAG: hypothetical protein C0P65_002820 [Lysobacteraceae bacterium]